MLELYYVDELDTILEELGELSALETLKIKDGMLKSLPKSLGHISSGIGKILGVTPPRSNSALSTFNGTIEAYHGVSG
jgi:hypothetical protein